MDDERYSYRSKAVERVRLPPRDERTAALEAAGYNVFDLAGEDVFVDLLTDSGTGAMSDAQWAALHTGDESYAGSRSFEALREAVREVTGFERVVPVHQGRGGEHVLYGALAEAGDHVPNNTHFDTTRAHVAAAGAEPVDCPTDGATDPEGDAPFKGDLDVAAVRELAAEVGADRVPAVVVTLTNNSMAGQPVSVANVRAARAVADEVDALLVVDACRFAENAHFVVEREPEFADWSVADVVREQLGYADALVVSGKKDGLVNSGGFLALSDDVDDALYEAVKQRTILYEGFPTYGGMAGREMAAMAVGLREAVTEAYLEHRVGQVRRLADRLERDGVPVYRPVGGHAVYVDAGRALPGIPDEQFPGQAFVCELYREGGVRGVELGSFAFPDADRPELVRLALPRRTYHDEHLAHVAAAAGRVVDRRDEISGLEVVSEPGTPELRHFSADLAPVE